MSGVLGNGNIKSDGTPFAPNFVDFGSRTILNVPQGTPPVGDPSSSRYASKFGPSLIDP